MELNKDEFIKFREMKQKIKEELKQELKNELKQELLEELKPKIQNSFWNKKSPLIKELYEKLEAKGYYGHSTTQSMFVPYLKVKFNLSNILNITEEEYLQEKDFIYSYIDALPQKKPIIRNETGLIISGG